MGWDAAGLDWFWISRHAAGWLLVLARVVGMCATAPVLAAPGLDMRFRFGVSVLLTILISPVINLSTTGTLLVWSVLAEALMGVVLGWGAGLIVGGAQLAGDLVASQAGLLASTFFDPESGEEMTAVGQLYGWVATVVFLSLDGPLMLVRSLVESYRTIPAGGLFSTRGSAIEIFRVLGQVLELTLRAAAPTAIALVLAGIVMGWLSRAAPSFPLIALTLPVRAMLGIILVLMGLGTLTLTLATGWQSLLAGR